MQEDSAMRERLEVLSMVLDLAPIPMWIKRMEGTTTRMLRINLAYERRWGITREQCEGRTDEEVWGPEVAAQFLANDLEAIARAPLPVFATERVPDLLDPEQAEEEIPVWLVAKRAGESKGLTYIAGIAYREDETLRTMQALRDEAESEGRGPNG